MTNKLCKCGCGQEVKHYNSKYIRGHWNKYKKNGISKNCLFCLNEYYVGLHRIKISKYCSKQCKSNYEKEYMIAWNKGLTKEIDERVRKYVESQVGQIRFSVRGEKNGNYKKLKNKTYKEIFGEEKAIEIIQKRKNTIKNIDENVWKEINKKKSNTLKKQYETGERIPYWLGKKFSKERNEKIKKWHEEVGFNDETLKGMSERWKGKNNPGYKDGRNKLDPMFYGDDWDKIRYGIYLRDNFTCQNCNIKGTRLDIHHKIPFRISKDNSLNNLITLCRSCHMKEEQKIRKELKQNKILTVIQNG